MNILHGIVLLTLMPGVSLLQSAAGQTTRAVGDVVRFPERAKEGSINNVLKRIGWKLPNDGSERDYDLTKESFVVYAPSGSEERAPQAGPLNEKGWGLMAFVSPSDSGAPPEAFIPLLEKHHLMWVGANHVGNKRAVWCRIGITLDGIANVKAKYPIDERRIYVCGVSGGGRVSSFIAICFPDVVHGGMAIIGADYFKQLPTGRNANEYWPKAFDRPVGKLLLAAKTESRYVMLNGDGDQNRFQSAAIAREMTRDGFKHVTYLEAPGVGHRLPSEDWVERGILKLDEPLADLPDDGGRATAGVAATGPATQPGGNRAKMGAR